MQPNATGVELFRGKPVPVRYFATSPYLEVATKVRLAHEEGGFTEVSHEFVRVGDKDVIQICIEVKGQRFCGSAQIKSCTLFPARDWASSQTPEGAVHPLL